MANIAVPQAGQQAKSAQYAYPHNRQRLTDAELDNMITAMSKNLNCDREELVLFLESA